MSATPSPSHENNGQAGSIIQNTPGSPWRILLVELINLLGLFFKHARHAKGARATAALFDQMMRLMEILDKMPGHDGGLIIRRIGPGKSIGLDKPDYFVLFGNQAFRGSLALPGGNHVKNSRHHLAIALEQAFACLHDQGIFSFYLQLPGKSPEKIDQLRLALNIVARFRTAVENNASVTFRYYGRALTVPLIRDSNGRPNPNLTLVSGLNGISTINMRELVKQAVAFCRLYTKQGEDECTSDNYNKIFSVRSLRSQLIQPMVEINNLPWMKVDDLPDQPMLTQDESNQVTVQTIGESDISGNDADFTRENLAADRTLTREEPPLEVFDIDLSMYLNSADQKALETIDSLFDFNFDTLTIDELGNHIGLITRLLNNMRSQASDASIAERFLLFLHDRLRRFPQPVLDQVQIRRQGLNIELGGRKMIVGLAHPRLLDLILLAKERVAMQRKIEAFRGRNSEIFSSKDRFIADIFDLSDDESEEITAKLRRCFDPQGRFDRSQFVSHVGQLASYGQTVFESLWCILRYSALAGDRLAILNSLPLLVERLHDSKSAVSFLLTDLLQKPAMVEPSDRNAFVLATLMLRTHNKERNIDIQSTPEEVMAVRKSLNHEMVHFVAKRLDMDRSRIQVKFRSIREALCLSGDKAPSKPSGNELGTNLLMALEREGFIFLTLSGGRTAHLVLREALSFYSDPQSSVYQNNPKTAYLTDLMDHLRVILRGMVRLGQPQDLELFKRLEQSAPRIMTLDTDPSFTQKVKRTLQWVAPGIRAIQVQLQ